MIEFIKSWIVQIITLVMFIVLLEILVPSGKIRKFINLVSGFILIIAIVNPFLHFFKNGIDLKEFQYKDANFIDQREIETNSKIFEDQQMKQITEVYKKKVAAQIEKAVKEIKGVGDVKVDVSINEDHNAENFGEIRQVCLGVSPAEDSNAVKPVSKVDKIKVNKSENPKDTQKEISSDLNNKIRDKINKLLEVNKENIVIEAL